MDEFFIGTSGAEPSLASRDTPDDDGAEDIESDATLSAPVSAGCDNAESGSTNDATNELLDLVLLIASAILATTAMLVCALLSFTEVVSSKCAVEVLRADNVFSGTTGAEPSLLL